MDKVTQANAASAEQSASASEELSAQAQELETMVDVLVSMIRASGDGGAEQAVAGHAGPEASNREDTGRTPEDAQDWSPANANTYSKSGT